MLRVRFFTLLQLLLNKKELELSFIPGETIGELLSRVQQQIDTPFLHKLLEESGGMKTGTIIMINGRHVFHLDKVNTLLSEGDEVALFPPGGGG
ncbi:MoaD family protein [Marispirochaeta sp.]|jgi:sulfur-carrier protein|uniref:MoaD family protein n=1 Tax=Marispirochaeta sp. TaxID=2038653 RepID=UPI0029C7B565|nr:MoaD family protein [Marispirochaeta sp.]